MLGAPVAWAAQLAANYVLEEWIACAPASATPGALLGFGVETWVLSITTAMTAVGLAALAVSLRCYKRTKISDPSTGGRARWMALAGIINSFVFLLPIGLGFATPLLLETCRTSA